MNLLKYAFIAMLAIGTTTGFAQINESERSMSTGGVFPALSIVIPDTDDKDVMKWWKNYMKDQDHKVKRVRKGDELMTEGVKDVEMNGVTPITYFARTEEAGEDTEHIVWIKLGEDDYLNAGDGAAYQAGAKMMLRFGLYVTKRKTEIALKEQERLLKDFENDLTRLGKDNKNYNDKIDDAKKLIGKMEANIEQNLKDQEKKQQEIEMQKEIILDTKKRLSELN